MMGRDENIFLGVFKMADGIVMRCVAHLMRALGGVADFGIFVYRQTLQPAI